MNTPPVITPNAHLTLHYRLSLIEDGGGSVELVSTYSHPPATLQLGSGQLSPGLEACLLGLAEGEHRVIDVPAGKAFGERNPDLIQRVSRETYNSKIDPKAQYAVGDLVDIPGPRGGHFRGVLQQLDDESALFDFNHPLAGRAVIFEVSIIGVIAS